MSRLTKVYPNGFITLDASKFPPIDQNALDSEIRNSLPFSETVKKLNQYENSLYGQASYTRPARKYNDALQKIISLYQENIAPITAIVMHSMADWLNDVDADVIEWAITEAVSNNKRSWKYIEGILKNHFNAGRTTLAAVQDAQRTYKVVYKELDELKPYDKCKTC